MSGMFDDDWVISGVLGLPGFSEPKQQFGSLHESQEMLIKDNFLLFESFLFALRQIRRYIFSLP